jgi:hypothetical protein
VAERTGVLRVGVRVLQKAPHVTDALGELVWDNRAKPDASVSLGARVASACIAADVSAVRIYVGTLTVVTVFGIG